MKNSSNLKCQKVKLQGFGHISVLGRRRVGECSILQSSCCKSSPGRSETSDATGLLAVGFSLFSWRREITRRRRIFCPMSKSATKRLRSKGNHANSQFAQCNYIKLNELRIIMLLDEIRYCKIIIIIKFVVRAVGGCRPAWVCIAYIVIFISLLIQLIVNVLLFLFS